MTFYHMKKISIILFFGSLCFDEVFAQLMFRGGPEHQGIVPGNSPIISDLNWKFNAEAPIRSSPITTSTAVFFGTSEGIFYSLDKKSGRVLWKYNTGSAIASSPAILGNDIYFSDNRQSLYCLGVKDGKLRWKFDFEKSRNYEWSFDYFYSSPTIYQQTIIIGGKDGNVYRISKNGKLLWKFLAKGIVRSTPAIANGVVFVGDTEGILYALDVSDGKEKWKFNTEGNTLKNEDFGFDRKAIISSPAVINGKVVVGSRDGFLYGIDASSGQQLWKVDHQVSWVISSVAIKDSITVTGTSDGRFIQAVNIHTGKEIWKYRTISIVWSSPVIHGNKVYIGSQEGLLYCMDLYTGKKLNAYQAGGKIFTSPNISDTSLFFGSDNGYLYCLKPGVSPGNPRIKRYVFWEPGINIYFRFGTDVKIKEYLALNGYKVVDGKILSEIFGSDSAHSSVVVFASNYFPRPVIEGYDQSLMRKFLNNGGRVLVLGNNPFIFKTDPVTKTVVGRSFLLVDSVINIKYGPDDLRSFKGIQPAFSTPLGKKWGLPKFWVSPLSLPASQVDEVLGLDENGLASAWVKRFSKVPGSGFIQIWVDSDNLEDPGFVLNVAENGF